MKWKDESSYSRGERGKVEPSCWSLVGCDFNVIVHRQHGIPGNWYVTCSSLTRQGVGIPEKDLAKAQVWAVNFVHRLLEDMLASLRNATTGAHRP